MSCCPWLPLLVLRQLEVKVKPGWPLIEPAFPVESSSTLTHQVQDGERLVKFCSRTDHLTHLVPFAGKLFKRQAPPRATLPFPLFSPSKCRGFTCISEDSSEITFLLVENYIPDRSLLASAGRGIFRKLPFGDFFAFHLHRCSLREKSRRRRARSCDVLAGLDTC